MDNPIHISVIFLKTCELCTALGWVEINKQPGCQEHQIDEQWYFAINPHNETTECSKGTMVPPFGIYFEFNGWPAGMCDPSGGAVAAGKIANEETLIAALEAAIEKTGAPPLM